MPKRFSITADSGQALVRSTSRNKDKSNPKDDSNAKVNIKAAQPRTTRDFKHLPKEPHPAFVPPQLAMEAVGPPEQTGWLHELKLDGYRIQARKSGDNVEMLTRKGLDWTHRMPDIANAIKRLPVNDLTLDGEVVVLGADGTTSFAALQASFHEHTKQARTYFVFDLLHVEGHNPRKLPLLERKRLLAQLLTSSTDPIRLSEHIETGGKAMFHKACELHAEGIVSKRTDGPYRPGRGGDWLKSKCLHEQEFVIGGYTLSSEGADRIGSLLLGYYSAGSFIYAGRTGTGFTQKMKRSLLTQLKRLATSTTPFEHPSIEARRDALWVKPTLVAQVRFATWTTGNLVRQAAFLGLREDKPAHDVRREEVTIAPKSKASHRVQTLKALKSAPLPKSAAPDPALRLTHPEKILDPESKLTKLQLAEYYWAVAEWMLPHIADRPLSLVRCPDGAGKPCFFQKHVNQMLPPGIRAVDVPNKKTGKPEPYITLNTAVALAGLAQMGVLEVHPWGSTNNDLEHPDRLIFDLDPDESLPWAAVTSAADDVHKRLKVAGLESFLKTTGGKGLHVVVPIVPELDWAQLKDVAHNFVLAMEQDKPDLYLTKMSKAARRGKIYLDYLRNERGATAVAPYSPRARVGGHVSLPLPWTALKLKQRPVFSVADFNDWKPELRKNPWAAMLDFKQSIKPLTLGEPQPQHRTLKTKKAS